jgi:TonB-linked SusC/RagA family outer membrane protein
MRIAHVRKSMNAFRIAALLIWHAGPVAGQATAPTEGRATAQSAAASGASSAASVGGDTQGGAPIRPLERRVSLHLQDVRLNDALKEINRQARLGLTYTPRVVPVNKRVTIEQDSITAGEALDRVLRGTGTKAVVTEAGTVALVRGERRSERVDSAAGVVLGQVLDAADGRPLAGAVVTVEGTALRDITTDSGWYGIPKVPAGMQTLVVRFLGYQSAEKPVLVVDNRATRTDFALRMAMSRLQETVTTATGQRRRVELGNDITVIDADSIVATQPVTSVTSLLEGRVPGLSVLHSSGAPGDPSRLRLRGLGSILRSNDPIVVVDGIRVYSEQSSDRSNNLAQSGFTTPSPIDQIDPASIETIEVLKGPSAATLYGQDAANGVIVITTRKGRQGPPRWTMSATRGVTTMPGRYPVGYFGWGHKLADNGPILCAVRDPTCAQDSLARFQLLNDPELTVLGHGDRTALTAGVSGGSESLTYSVSGNFSDEMGLIRLPDVEAARYTDLRGTAPPEWMRHPQRYTTWGAATRLGARLGSKADVSLTAMLQRGTQRRSSLEHQLDGLMGTYFDRATGQYYVANPGSFYGYDINDQLLSDYFRRVEDVATTFTNGVNATWRPRSWLTASADAGLQLLNRDDESLLPPGMPTSFVGDTVGSIGIGHGQSLMRTINVRTTASAPLPHGFHFRVALGANYTNTSTRDFSITGRGLSPGTSAISGARDIDRPGQGAFDITSFGWYVEPSISHDRFWLSTGLRLDGGSTFGTQVKLPSFPKLSVSYLISDEPFFPFKRIFNTLRLRVAYGQAGTWPGPADRLRLFQQQSRYIGSTSVNTLELESVGNTHLKPERSKEIEGGFDADILGDRVSISLTGYRKTRYDALMSLPIPASVYGGGSILRNIGVIRNTGLELSLDVQPVRTDPITVSTRLHLSSNRNRVLSLADDVGRFCTSGSNSGCVAAGYPLLGVWARPIVGYADANGNGIITADEVLVADSLAFMGEQLPNYEASLHTSLSFFRSAVTVSGSFAYQDGLTQTSYAAGNNVIFSQGLNDPGAPLGAQAAAVATPLTSYGAIQTVSTLRFTSLAIAYNVAPSIARRLGARSLSIALQGTNLGLWTDYRGKDPNVSATATGNGVVDRNALPTPRTWQVRVSASY